MSCPAPGFLKVSTGWLFITFFVPSHVRVMDLSLVPDQIKLLGRQASGKKSPSDDALTLCNDKGCRQVFFVEVISSPVPTLKSQLQDQSSQRRRGNLPPSSSGRSSASTLKSSTPARQRRSPPLSHTSTSPAVNRKKRGQPRGRPRTQQRADSARWDVGGKPAASP